MNLDAQKPVDVRRLGSTLVASFHRADPPLVWRFDLERHHSFSLALQGDEGDWELGLTSAKGDFQPIARFAHRDDAEDAFIKVEKILARQDRLWKFSPLKIMGFLALALLISLMVYGIKVVHELHSVTAASVIGSLPLPTSNAMKSGVPLPADQFLTPPQ